VTSPVPATALDHQLVDITGVQVVWAADSLSRQWAARLGARGRRREAAVIRPPATAQSQGLPVARPGHRLGRPANIRPPFHRSRTASRARPRRRRGPGSG